MSTLGVLYSAQERLNHFFGGESGSIEEVLAGVEQLNTGLGIIADSLSDSVGREVNRQVRELAYDIENSVECFVRQQEVEASSASESKCSYLWGLLKYCSSYERSFLEDLDVFRRRVMALVDWISSTTSSGSRDNHLTPQLIDRQFVCETGLEEYLIDPQFVCETGLEESEKNLKRHLLEGEQGLSVIAICGMGGLGKTTLLRKVYNENEVRERFDCFAWSTVSPDYHVRHILESILTAVSRKTNCSKVASMDTMELVFMLNRFLKCRRYLICLDGVWSTDAWDSLRFFFPDGHNQSRIVITTRSMEVARCPSCCPIQMETLNEEQSWELFLIKSGLQDTPGMSNPQILETGKQIVRRFRSAQVHSVVRDLCIGIGKLEEFFEVIDFSHQNKLSTSTCRLAVYLHKLKDARDFTLNIPDAKRIRTIMFFDKVEPIPNPKWPEEVADLRNFRQIRVLDFNGVNFLVRGLPWGLEKLIYLRHLSFRGCYLHKFPSSFGSFSFLETLDLCVVDYCIMTIPDVLRKLTRLRHLYFPLQFRCDGKDKLKLGCLQNLEILENFHSGSCDAEDLLQLENLQILKGTVDGNNADLTNFINSIKKMKSICHSSLAVKRFDCYSIERFSIVAEILQCGVVNALDLEGHLGALPHYIVFGFNLTKMVLNESQLSENPMPILGRLPDLKSLVLCKNAFMGPNLVCYESDFPKLEHLKLASLKHLETWEVESGAMRSLTILTIEKCYKLEMLPSELRNIPTLQKLMIGSMSENFQLKVEETPSQQVVSYY
ncbi:hypothetical protein C2S51_006738 [Perilla frutescens var. frutescens]|nr:hypothetical protein C2S51_006738 [Perilla frutescens var. frutescens]